MTIVHNIYIYMYMYRVNSFILIVKFTPGMVSGNEL